MINVNTLLIAAAFTGLSLGAAPANAEGVGGDCRSFYAAGDQSNKRPLPKKFIKPGEVKPGKWELIDGSKDTYRLVAACEKGEAAVGGGFHWNNPSAAKERLKQWTVVGSSTYHARGDDTKAQGWMCVAQYKTDNAGTNKPWDLWCSVVCCRR